MTTLAWGFAALLVALCVANWWGVKHDRPWADKDDASGKRWDLTARARYPWTRKGKRGSLKWVVHAGASFVVCLLFVLLGAHPDAAYIATISIGPGIGWEFSQNFTRYSDIFGDLLGASLVALPAALWR